MSETVNLDPLLNISHQDIQHATEEDLVNLATEQLNHINSQLSSSELAPQQTQTVTVEAQQQQQTVQYVQQHLHYQLQGTWQTPGGKYVNYIILKDSMESKIDISRIYFNMEDINKCRGFNLDLTGANDRFHLNLLNIILEFPNSEFVLDLFRDFLASLTPLASTEVHEAIPTPMPTIIEGKGPKIQLKVEGFCLNEDLLDTTDNRDNYIWNDNLPTDNVHHGSTLPGQSGPNKHQNMENDFYEGKHKLYDSKKSYGSSEENTSTYQVITTNEERSTGERKEKMTVDEKRFFEICRNLGQRPVRKDHFLLIGTGAEPSAMCMHCKARFSCNGGSEGHEDLYTDTIRQVIDHVLVQHFQTFAYECDNCSLTFNTKESYDDHMKNNHKEELEKFQCRDCSVGFYSKKELKLHEKLMHEASQTGLALKCKSCNKSFSSKKTMHAHMRGIHGISSKTPKKPKKETTCQLCGENKKEIKTSFKFWNRKYHTPFAIELHMKQIHSGGGEGKLVCEYCCKEFHGSLGKVKFALKEHIQAQHLGIRKVCNECGKNFISNIVLNKHKKHVHRREAQYPCKGCGRIFRYSQQAIDHEYKDRGITPYECKNCPFKTSDNWALAKHKKTCSVQPASLQQSNMAQEDNLRQEGIIPEQQIQENISRLIGDGTDAMQEAIRQTAIIQQ